jgi:sugar fermentation stimulation protein A
MFLVHSPNVRWFLPDYHTDPVFSETLMKVKNRVHVIPIALDWRPDLSLGPKIKRLEIPWQFLKREARDRGSYILVLRLGEERGIQTGRLGELSFQPGYYLYVGSAQRALTARLARHARLRKKLHWHIDYLRQAADSVVALPIRSSRRDECTVAGALSQIFAEGPRGFGSSDCSCRTHLYFAPANPLESAAFHEVLQRFRMQEPAV